MSDDDIIGTSLSDSSLTALGTAPTVEEAITSSDHFHREEEVIYMVPLPDIVTGESSTGRSDIPAQKDGEDTSAWNTLKNIFNKSPSGRRWSQPETTHSLHKMPRPEQAGKETPEDAKYEREYQDMVKAFREKERKAQLEKTKSREQREKRIGECGKIWKQSDIIANWEQRKGQRKTRDLVMSGIPPNIRTTVWPLLLGNRLQLTPELFKIYVAQAARMREQEGPEIGKERSLKVIDLDLPRTFPALSFFQPEGPLHLELRNVLEAYVCYRPDIGYVQGMSFLASMFLLVMDSPTSFQCLSNLLNRPLFLGFFRMDIDHIDRFADAFERALALFLPDLAECLKYHGITPHIYSMDWVLTLFSKSMPLDSASRLWDCIFYEGEIFIFRAGIALLSLCEGDLLGATYDQCMLLLTHLPFVEEDKLFKTISNYPLTPKSDKEIELYFNTISNSS